MLYLLSKYLITAGLVVLVSELAKRSDWLGGLLAELGLLAGVNGLLRDHRVGLSCLGVGITAVGRASVLMADYRHDKGCFWRISASCFG